MYCTTADAYRTAGITSSVIPADDVTQFILEAEEEVDRITNTTYWAVGDSGTATSSTNDTIVQSTKSWTVDDHINDYVWIYSGTGSGQVRLIEDNDATSLTVDEDWSTNPDTTSKYRIFHAGKNPHIPSSEGMYDGDDTTIFYLPKYPLRQLVSVTIDGTSVSPSYIYQYPNMGKLMLNLDSSEVSYFTSKKAQKNVFEYWFGVYPLPLEIKRLTEMLAATYMLSAQMGGTYNVPSTYSLPEGSLTVGQAYINIKGTWDTLQKNIPRVIARVIKYHSFG